MQISKAKIYIAILLLFISTTGMLCNGGKRKSIAIATDDFAEAQVSTTNLLSNAKASGLVSQEDINEIKPFLIQANDLNAEAIKYGKDLQKNPTDQTSKDKLISTLNDLSTALVRANNAGLTRIKDLKLRTAFSALIITMQNAATSVIVLVKN